MDGADERARATLDVGHGMDLVLALLRAAARAGAVRGLSRAGEHR